MMKKLLLLICTVFVLFLVSCASAPGKGKDPYYTDNIKDFTKTTLSNGIPVIYKQNEMSQICVVRLVIEGGVPLVKPELGGVEDVTLQLMNHGSEKYQYSQIQKILFDESASISTSSGKDFSSVGFRCIKKSLDAVYDVFADSICHPLMAEEDFKTIMTEQKEGLQNEQSDPSSLLINTLQKNAYVSHSYAASDKVTYDTINNITLDEVKKHYDELKNASRVSIVVVGNFNDEEQKSFTSNLESSFGGIEKKDYVRPQIPPLEVSGENIFVPCETAGETGYAAGYFVCPNRNDSDYVPFAIATMFLDDILFMQVREQHGALYSIGTGVLPGRSSLGIISVYKATEKERIGEYINQAIDSFPDEKEIDEKLSQYKNKYITALFSSSQNTSGVAGNIISSIEYYGAPENYLNRSSQVHSVTAKQVKDAYAKYIAQSSEKALDGKINKIRWVVVSGKDSVNQFKF